MRKGVITIFFMISTWKKPFGLHSLKKKVHRFEGSVEQSSTLVTAMHLFSFSITSRDKLLPQMPISRRKKISWFYLIL